MTKPKREPSKKHGDKLEPLIDDAAGRSPPEEEDAPALLQDDADEDVESDDVDDRRDVGERD